MFCCIPGIFLYVPLSLSFAIMVYSKRSVTDSFGYSFDLVKEHWWMTFATIFVVVIIVTVATYAFSIPAAIYQYFKMGVFSGELDAENMNGNFIDPIYIILNLIATLARFLFNIISLVAITLIYFNLNEIKNNEGTMERIQKLGGDLDS
jgi:Mn2+/Fe2+ NRAMP family transporter